MKYMLALTILLFVLSAKVCGMDTPPPSADELEKHLVFVINKDKQMGSGFILRDGYVMTAAHLWHKKGVQVYKSPHKWDKDYEVAKEVYYDKDDDLMILKVPWVKGSVSFAPYKPSLGEEVYNLGFTSGDPMMFVGRVAYHNYAKRTIELDIGSSLGASGSAIFNRKGEVVGMTSYLRPLGYGQNVLGIIPGAILERHTQTYAGDRNILKELLATLQ